MQTHETSASDAFICHASEDKDDFARPLAHALRSLGAKIWYDEFSLDYGEGLRESIDWGLAKCKFCIVVLSPAFFAKEWAARELSGVFAREIIEKQNIIIPVYYNISAAEVAGISPLIAGKFALIHSGDIAKTIRIISKIMKIDQPYEHSYGEQMIDIKDEAGRIAEWTIKKAFIVGSLPLSKIEFPVHNRYGTEFLWSSGGRVEYPVDVSGQRVARVHYDEPLPPGAEFVQEVRFSIADGFSQKTDVVNVYPKQTYPFYRISVKFPLGILLKRTRAYEAVGNVEVPAGEPKFDSQLRELSVHWSNLSVGNRYCLEWECASDEIGG